MASADRTDPTTPRLACPILDNFLIKLNKCRNEINATAKQLSDNLIIRRDKLLSELDQFEKIYKDSRNAEHLLKQSPKYKNDLKSFLKAGLREDTNFPMKLANKNLDNQIANLRKKIVAFLNFPPFSDNNDQNPNFDSVASIEIDPLQSLNTTTHKPTQSTNIKSYDANAQTRMNPQQISPSVKDTIVEKKRSSTQLSIEHVSQKDESEPLSIYLPTKSSISCTPEEIGTDKLLNKCRKEMNIHFKQIHDNLISRQSKLDQQFLDIEEKHSKESQNIINEIKKLENVKNVQETALKTALNISPEDAVAGMRDVIKVLESRIADLKEKMENFADIEFTLDTTSINSLIQKLGTVALNQNQDSKSNNETPPQTTIWGNPKKPSRLRWRIM